MTVQNCTYANLLLPILYKSESVVLNMHNLIHLANDMKNMGHSLTKINAFSFESFLGKLKNLIRTPNQSLSQLCRRIYKQILLKTEKPVRMDEILIIKKKFKNNGFVNIFKLQYKKFTLTNKLPDNVVFLTNDTFFKIYIIFYNRESPNNILEGAV